MKNSPIGQSAEVSSVQRPRLAIVAEPAVQTSRGAEVFAVDWQLPDERSGAS